MHLCRRHPCRFRDVFHDMTEDEISKATIVKGLLIGIGVLIGFGTQMVWSEVVFDTPSNIMDCEHLEFAKFRSSYTTPSGFGNSTSGQWREDMQDLRDKGWRIDWQKTTNGVIVAYC